MTATQEKRRIEMKPLPLAKWHGKSGKESITRPKIIESLPDNTMNYQIALSKEKNIEWEENGNKTMISELEKYGKLIGQDLSTQFILGQEHPFYSSRMARVTLEDNPAFFDVNNPIEYVKLAIVKASPFVANSLKDWEDGKYPQATHYIVDENYEVEQYKKKRNKEETVSKSLKGMVKDEKANLLFLLSGRPVDSQSEDFIDMHLENEISKNINQVLNYIDMDKSEFALTALVNKAVKFNHLTKEGHKYKYQDSVIGNSLEEVIGYLKDDENQTFKLDLINKVENTM